MIDILGVSWDGTWQAEDLIAELEGLSTELSSIGLVTKSLESPPDPFRQGISLT